MTSYRYIPVTRRVRTQTWVSLPPDPLLCPLRVLPFPLSHWKLSEPHLAVGLDFRRLSLLVKWMHPLHWSPCLLPCPLIHPASLRYKSHDMFPSSLLTFRVTSTDLTLVHHTLLHSSSQPRRIPLSSTCSCKCYFLSCHALPQASPPPLLASSHSSPSSGLRWQLSPS